MVDQEYDERLLCCQECGRDFLYGIEDQKRDDRDQRPIPAKCPRCRSGQKPQPAKQQSNRPRNQGGRGRGRAQQFAEEYRSPSFPQGSQPEYRGPAFSNSDPSRSRRGGGGGPRSQQRSGSRQRYQITCSECGRTDTIPFRPSPNRPVYCHECYETHKYEDKKGRSGGRGHGRGS
jgi:CxxC-x17-CxxC domain-containing protein